MTRPLLEVCIDSRASAMAAIRGGADRIELCAALSEGGVTPSAGFMREAASWPVPVYAMIRPRGGDFTYSDAEVAIMEEDIAFARSCGLAGVVFGAALGGALDTAGLRRLGQAAGTMGMTLHRVVDTLPDPTAAISAAIDFGFERILTSGGAATAQTGAATIAEMVARANGRISIMPGAGVTPENAAGILRKTNASEIHASCTHKDAPMPRETDPALVRALVAAIDA
ncbi:MAG: copper homeostasis protein CutC [Rhodobacteraceae bacterium]|nr:copper homeostasis protein CutC [Paracoccaceae bacterium]